MKVPVEWVNEYLTKKLSVRAMADALERAGVEVEAIKEGIVLDPKIVVGCVLAVQPHPNADKLRIAQIDVKHTTLSIVCGASNLKTGQHVPAAQVGAKLPDGTTIGAAQLRGAESQGMICSEQELGLSSNQAGIMVLGPESVIGSKASSYVNVSDVIDTTTSANRWDMNGIVWQAKEIAAHSEQKLHIEVPEQHGSSSELGVTIADPKLVPRYILTKLSVDPSLPTPQWMQQRLQAAGTRSINVVVDVTNYVMVEYAQPLHAFDAAKVQLPVVVRKAEKGEKLVTLDGVTRNLDTADLLITDNAGPIGFAGVMGGKNSEVDDATTEIYLEAAVFDGTSIRRTALRHGLRTDSSARFERGLPLNLPPLASARAVELLIAHAGAKFSGEAADRLQIQPTTTKITVNSERISAVLGLALSTENIQHQLARLQFEAERGPSGADLSITVPWWRPDITFEEDIAEEVMKLVGYDQLPATIPAWAPKDIGFDTHWQARWRAKAALRSLGLFEVVTYSFISAGQVESSSHPPERYLKLKNPLSSEQAYLRMELWPSMLRVAERNRTYGRNFGLFEFSKVYIPKSAGELPDEPLRLGVLIRAERDGYRGAKAALDRLCAEFNVAVELDAKGIGGPVPYPNRAAFVTLGGKNIGWIGQLHPNLAAHTKLGGEIGFLEIEWTAFAAAARPVLHQPVSRFPSVSRDISIEINRQISWQKVKKELSDYDITFLSDYYGGELATDKKALALRIAFSAPDRTLTDAEADAQLQDVIKQLSAAFQATIRS